MQSTEPSPPRPPLRVLAPFTGAARGLARGALLGAAFGAVEMALRVHGALEPSVARRGLELVAYAAVLYGVAGGLTGLFVGGVAGALRAPLARLRGLPSGGGATPAPRRSRRPLHLAAAASLVLAFAYAAWTERAVEPPFPAPPPPAASGPRRPDVVLVLIDTLRADALGCYGGASTPALDALAERGTLFEDVVSPTSWTLPAVASLLTATPPWRHGVTDYDRFLPRDLAGLPERFAAAGYACVGVVGNPLLSRLRGFDRGFHFYDVYSHELEARLFLGRLFAAALRELNLVDHARRKVIPWLEPRFPFLGTRLTLYTRDEDLNRRLFARAPWPADRPLFLYVHYTNPHTPYLEHPFRALPGPDVPDPSDPEGERARYAGEVAYTDGVVGELLDELAARGRLADTFVLVTSDHGEEFGEHGRWEHGHDLHGEVVRVPWILTGPGVPAGRRVPRRVRLVDVAPTLLARVGLGVPPSFAGRDVLAPEAGPADEPVYLELTSRFLEPRARHFGVAAGRYKVLRRRDPDGALLAEEAYDLAADPGERAPLATLPPAARALLPGLDEHESRPRLRGRTDPDDLEAMRALGYVGDDAER